jgi:cytochrome c oxidase cbb3-type subunit 3
VIGLVSLAVVTAAQEKDMETVSAALALRAEGLIIARCSVCHSADLIRQQRLPRARWEATVEKMEHWGAEISNDEADLLVRYLSARYHPDAPDQLPPLDNELRKAEPLTQ